MPIISCEGVKTAFWMKSNNARPTVQTVFIGYGKDGTATSRSYPQWQGERNARNNRRYLDSIVAAGTRECVHDGRVHPYPAGCGHRGRADPRDSRTQRSLDRQAVQSS